jgi:hypothetical protein
MRGRNAEPVATEGKVASYASAADESSPHMETLSTWLSAPDGSFAAAAANAGLIERWYTIAARSARFRFAGSAVMERIAPAFAHLEGQADGNPALTVDVWDAESTGTAPPPVPPGQHEFDDEAVGALYHYQGDSVRAVYQPGFGALSVLRPNGTAFYWLDRAEDLPYWEQASPVRQILQWWLAAHAVQLVHAGAVGTPAGGVLLVGNPGSGKSTAALASLESRLSFAGDDYVAVALDPELFVYSLYSTGKVDPGHVRRLPHVAPLISNAARLDVEKAVVHVQAGYAHKIISGFPLRAILLPKVRGSGETRMAPVPRPVALTALAPSTIVQLHTARGDALTRMRELVARVPAFALELGVDVYEAPLVIQRFLEEL